MTTSPLWTAYSATSNELITRSFLEIVRMGSEADAGARFDQFVSDWQGGGGSDAQAEMNEVLTALYG